MARAWKKDFNRSIVRGNAHWKTNPPTAVDAMYHTCLSFNALMNLFEDDNSPDSNVDNTKTTFEDYYENYSIATVLSKFRARMETWELQDPGVPAKHPEQFPITDFDNAYAAMSRAISRAEDPQLVNASMKDLYLNTYYTDPNRLKLELILNELDTFRSELKWICIPFLNFKRDVIDVKRQERPTPQAYNAHLDGWRTSDQGSTPTYPDGKAVNEMLGVREFDMRGFLFYKAPKADEQRRMMMLDEARKFATQWGFFDALSVDSRNRQITNQVDAAKDADEIGLMSSGNGYECSLVGGRHCVPAQQSKFCVNNGTEVCP